jgi:DNA-binding CsgD family transcriptional regulator
LNVYVAPDAAHFVPAALDLLDNDRRTDFSVALVRKPASRFFIAHHSRGMNASFYFTQQQAALLRAARAKLSPAQKILVVPRAEDAAANENLAAYRADVMDKLGSAHAALLFIGEHSTPPSLLLSAHRGADAAEFDAGELARLEAVRRYIENAWSLLTQRLLSRVLIDGISRALRNYDLASVVLDARLRVAWHNRAARTALQTWKQGGAGELKPVRHMGALPAEIIAACEKLRADWLAAPDTKRLRQTEHVPHPTRPGLSATVQLYGARETGVVVPGFIVHFEFHAGAAPAPAPSIMSALTASEREVALLLRQGMGNQEIADALGKSVDAVKFHLHQMFKKADVTTRSRLMLALR